MAISRRTLIWQASLCTSVICARELFAQSSLDLPLPPPDKFESGDFLWPKKPGAYVPYNGLAVGAFEDDARAWRAARDAFVASQSQASRAGFPELPSMTFREFHARYAGDQKPNVPGAYSSGAGIYVGHVGILDVDSSGVPWVIEAMPAPGVARIRYDDWIKGRSQQVVWHGRLREIGNSERMKIAEEARKYIGRKYDFWNFNLNDDTSFYCSKLVWLAIWRSLNIPIDGDANPKRRFWLSPKQVLYAKTVTRLHDPGAYANL